MASAPYPPTYPDAGVIATRPATAPEATPTALMRPVRAWEMMPHVRAAAAAAVLVTRKAFDVQRVGRQARSGVEAEPAEP